VDLNLEKVIQLLNCCLFWRIPLIFSHRDDSNKLR